MAAGDDDVGARQIGALEDVADRPGVRRRELDPGRVHLVGSRHEQDPDARGQRQLRVALLERLGVEFGEHDALAPTNRWVHLAAVVDRTAETLTSYADGVHVTTSSISSIGTKPCGLIAR